MAFIRIVVVTLVTMCLASNIVCLSSEVSPSKKGIATDIQDPNEKMSKVSQVHSFSVDEMKRQLKESKGYIIHAIRQALHESFPELYNEIETVYLPEIIALKEDLAPIFKKLISPQIQKVSAYTKRMGGRIVNKVHQSWELSNSTHINIVSISDILDDISKDMEYIQRSFTLPSAFPRRSKRSAAFMSYFMGFARPIFKSVATSIARSIDGHGNTLTSQLILPIVFDMIDDPVTFNDLQKLFWSTQSVVSPIFYETMKRQQQSSRYGQTYHIPQAIINSALQRLDYETKPILRKIMERQLPMILRRVSQNVRLIMQTIERVEATSGPKVHVLKMQLLGFMKRHGDLFGSTGTRYINSQTLVAMKQDLLPIKTTIFEIFMDYMSHSPNSWGNLIVSSFSMMGRF